ncbi:MAG: rhodanese-like domain-containing protein [Saprospiraceae bacterium]
MINFILYYGKGNKYALYDIIFIVSIDYLDFLCIFYFYRFAILLLWWILIVTKYVDEMNYSFNEIKYSYFVSMLDGIDFESYIIIDGRSPEDYNNGHIDQAINIDAMNNISLINLYKYKSKSILFIYCEFNVRSKLIVEYLYKLNYTGEIYILSEGYSKIISNP